MVEVIASPEPTATAGDKRGRKKKKALEIRVNGVRDGDDDEGSHD